MFDFRPDLIQYDKLQKSNALYNLNNAFEVAEEKLGLTRLLDPEGQCSMEVTLSKNGSNNLHKYHQDSAPPTPPKKLKTDQNSTVSKYPITMKKACSIPEMYKWLIEL